MLAFATTVAVMAALAYADVDCTTYAVTTQSSYSTVCTDTAQNNNKVHVWPVGQPATYCHGWEASDQGGNKEKMSANSIKCSPDASILYYTLYYGVIDCGAITKPNKVEERNYTSTCEKGDDNTYGLALDLSCCDTRGAGFYKCQKAAPSVQFSSNLGNPNYYANGLLCLNANTSKASTTMVAAPTTAKTAATTAAPVVPTAKPATTTVTATGSASVAAISAMSLVIATLAL
ncbi:hypothetical protein DYB25_005862 [Aphanomyces astaci]|uniref:Secreted protein n=2 Tax=Aphanomyces astaci TaxID=112090 RepID=A0A397EXJ4_APHAT|nr:hypothetical protein DYB25_005862 [Aphanomyces astaci]RHZ07282.1 hypothetical protein DYB31_001103 [Aphanomyces astaci]